jgi:hypothetical protein
MKRREFIAGVVGAGAWSLAARAQQPPGKMRLCSQERRLTRSLRRCKEGYVNLAAAGKVALRGRLSYSSYKLPKVEREGASAVGCVGSR